MPSQSQWWPLGGEIAAKPAVVAAASGRFDIVVKGKDFCYYHKAWDGAQWVPSQTGWTKLGDYKFVSAPSITYSSGRLYVFGQDIDGSLRIALVSSTGAVLGTTSLGGALVGGPAVYSDGSDRIDVYVRARDEAVYYKYYTAQTSWVPSWTGYLPAGGLISW